MTFDLTPEQRALVASAATMTSLPRRALDAVLAIEERTALQGSEDALAELGGRRHAQPLLMAAAAAIGIGRAAIAHAREWMKSNNVKPGPDETVPHWAFADGATDVEAARLLTYSAAQMLDRGENADDAITRAHGFASNAAQRAVEAAVRVVGAAGYYKGSLLERLGHEARALSVGR
ncbi:MAG TPA: acyl-CoA dehydrogenase family protein [Vicinamibacterales bacterium]|nr:acyl-CoA dehydrogenase family protein [Vicinamibacterales bacterium]